ncbi:MAG: STAS domain-containing protein [Phycisphaerales bacterium]|jgi:anti-sigma B factor antagonist|nr:STAS domain-containing protein [Phycisphaerales bacterium]
MSDAGLQISTRTLQGPKGPITIVTPVGDIDLNGAPTLKIYLRQAYGGLNKDGRLIVDMSAVPYMDSSGLATLIESMQASRRVGFALIVCGLSARVRAIFEIAKLQSVFAIVPTLDDAMAK